jgi:hypothetical protein
MDGWSPEATALVSKWPSQLTQGMPVSASQPGAVALQTAPDCVQGHQYTPIDA